MICFRVGDIKSATVSSQLTKMKTAKMKKMQVVNLLFLPFNYPQRIHHRARWYQNIVDDLQKIFFDIASLNAIWNCLWEWF